MPKLIPAALLAGCLFLPGLPGAQPAAPRETPPDPYEEEIPPAGLQSEEGFLLTIQRRVENTVRAAVDEELARLRAENERAEARLRGLANEATDSLRRAVRGELPNASPEAALTRAFLREFSARAGRSFSALTATLDPMEQSIFRRAVLEYANSLTPLTLYRSIRVDDSEEGETAMLSSPREGLEEFLRRGLMEHMDKNGFSLDGETEPLFEEGLAALAGELGGMEL